MKRFDGHTRGKMGRKLAWWMKGRMKDFALRVPVRFAELSNELAV